MNSPVHFSQVVLDVLQEFSSQWKTSVYRQPLGEIDPNNTFLNPREIRNFESLNDRARTLNMELRTLKEEVRQLRNSIHTSTCIDQLRLSLDQIQDILRANMYELLERTDPEFSIRNLPLLPRHLRLTARHLLALLLCLKQFYKFSEAEMIAYKVEECIKDFANDLLYLASRLKVHINKMDSKDMKIYIHSLMVDVYGLNQHIADLTSALKRFREFAFRQDIEIIESKQKQRVSDLQNITTISTLFSAVTATTLQCSYGSHKNDLDDVVNFFWFASLAFSIASAVNSLQALTWQQSTYAQVPRWLYYWIRSTPLLFLVISVVCFSLGLAVFSYSSSQHLSTSIFISGFTGVSSLGIFAVSSWFASARLTSSVDAHTKVFKDISFVQRFLHGPWDETKRLLIVGFDKTLSTTPKRRRMKRYLYVIKSAALVIRRLRDLEAAPRVRHRACDFFDCDNPIDRPAPAGPAISQELRGDISRLQSIQAKHFVRAHFKSIREICFSPDHKWFVTAGTDQTAVMTRMPPYQQPLTKDDFKVLAHPDDTVREVRWSPSGKYIMVRLRQGYKVWSTNGKSERVINRKRDVFSLIWLEGGEAFFSVEGHQVVKLQLNGKVLAIYDFPRMRIYDISVVPNTPYFVAVGEYSQSPDGRKPIRVSHEKFVLLYDYERKAIVEEQMILGDVRVSRVSKDGAYALLTCADRSAPQLWRLRCGPEPGDDANSDEDVSTESEQPKPYQRLMDWLGYNLEYRVSRAMSKIRSSTTTPNPSKLTLVHTLESRDSDKTKNPVRPIGHSFFCGKDEKWVSTLDKEGYVSIWDRETGTLLHHMRPHLRGTSTLSSMRWLSQRNSDERLVLALGASNGFVHIWEESFRPVNVPVIAAPRPRRNRVEGPVVADVPVSDSLMANCIG